LGLAGHERIIAGLRLFFDDHRSGP
jgi:hypothetical protein